MRIKSKRTINLEKEVPVYDITVPKTHNFVLANGVVVHNSKDVMDGIVGSYWSCKTAKKSGGIITVEKNIDDDLHKKLKAIKDNVLTQNPAVKQLDPQVLMNFMK